MEKKLGITEKKRKSLDLLHHFGKNLFSIKDASKIIGLPVKDTRLYLGYLARRGWLSRVKQGLYVSVPLGTANPQKYREDPWIVANKIFAPCCIGGWSAAEYWEITDQIFNSIFVFTARTFRKKNITIQGTEFVLKLVRAKKITHTKSVWIENVKVWISDFSQTMVDVLNDPAVGGGIRHVSDIIGNYFNSEYRNDLELLNYIKENKNRTVYKRLGYILEISNINAPDIIEECHKNISSGYSVLDPAIKTKGFFNRRWNLRVNAKVKK